MDAAWLRNGLTELGACDTLCLEAVMPLHGHMQFAVEKGDFIGKVPLCSQFEAYTRIMNKDFSDIETLPSAPCPSASWIMVSSRTASPQVVSVIDF